jgi:hypothetical protein
LEDARHLLHETLHELMGGERAATLMELLPPVGWGDVARRSDVEGLGRELRLEMHAMEQGLRGEMASLRHELRGEMDSLRHELRGEMDSLRHELRGEMGSLGQELRGEMGGLRHELQAGLDRVRAEMERQGRRLVMWNTSTILAVAGLGVAAARLL